MSSAKPTESGTGRAGWAALLPAGYHTGWVLASYVLVAIVIWASLSPGDLQPAIGHFDKLGHALAYCMLAAWFMGFHARERRWKVALWLLALGVALELMQQWMGLGRTGDLADLLANAVGVAAGTLFATVAGGWPRRVERWLGVA